MLYGDIMPVESSFDRFSNNDIDTRLYKERIDLCIQSIFLLVHVLGIYPLEALFPWAAATLPQEEYTRWT